MERDWRSFSPIFKELLNLELEPLAVSCLKESRGEFEGGKIRICRAILDSAKGKILEVSKENNACFGASWHLGFQRLNNPKVERMVKQFVVEGEKLFSSYQALERLISQMDEIPDNSHSYFILSPLEKSNFQPQIVIFICNPEQACRLLTLVIFIDGVMPKIKIGGPTCRMAIMYPLLKEEVNISFYDYTARRMCNLKEDKLLVSIPYKKIPSVVESIDRCSAGKAKIEYPLEFRKFLQKRLIR